MKNPAYVGSLAEVRECEEEVAEEIATEEKEDIKEKESEEKEDLEEETPSKKEDSEEEREMFSEEKVAEVPKELLIQIVDELIETKLNEIKEAEYVEGIANEQLEIVKEVHDEIESDLVQDCMKYNNEVIKMRLQLIKLNALKEGI